MKKTLALLAVFLAFCLIRLYLVDAERRQIDTAVVKIETATKWDELGPQLLDERGKWRNFTKGSRPLMVVKETMFRKALELYGTHEPNLVKPDYSIWEIVGWNRKREFLAKVLETDLNLQQLQELFFYVRSSCGYEDFRPRIVSRIALTGDPEAAMFVLGHIYSTLWSVEDEKGYRSDFKPGEFRLCNSQYMGEELPYLLSMVLPIAQKLVVGADTKPLTLEVLRFTAFGNYASMTPAAKELAQAKTAEFFKKYPPTAGREQWWWKAVKYLEMGLPVIQPLCEDFRKKTDSEEEYRIIQATCRSHK